MDNDLDEDLETEDEEEEFTPSAWDATLAPHRSALRSPDKTLKTRVSLVIQFIFIVYNSFLFVANDRYFCI
jgi:hypothetical protein